VYTSHYYVSIQCQLTSHFKNMPACDSLSIYCMASNTTEVLLFPDQNTCCMVYCELNMGYVVTVL